MIFLNLSEGLFLIGEGGINRIEPIDGRYTESPYKSVLYNNLTKISAVKETLEEIEQLLVDKVRK